MWNSTAAWAMGGGEARSITWVTARCLPSALLRIKERAPPGGRWLSLHHHRAGHGSHSFFPVPVAITS